MRAQGAKPIIMPHIIGNIAIVVGPNLFRNTMADPMASLRYSQKVMCDNSLNCYANESWLVPANDNTEYIPSCLIPPMSHLVIFDDFTGC